jgi:hypothetical protein
MITEDQYIGYFEKLARAHRQLQHEVDGKECFFEVEDPDELNSFDDALRNLTSKTVMLIVAGEGELNDNNSENHVQIVDCQLYILQKETIGISPADIRSNCIEILRGILGRTKREALRNQMIPGKLITFRINNVPLRKVGPMNLNWYGYTALISFSCPFGYTVDSGTWTDI